MKGRGAKINTPNQIRQHEYVEEHIEAQDEPLLDEEQRTRFVEEHPRKIVNKVDSPDVGMLWSVNPYQGCEHGCAYCYARNTHEYWGYSAGLDFERIVIVKKNAPELLRQRLMSKSWKPEPISLSGNTDCYQPIEQKLRLTRGLLEVLLEFRNPVGLITKNSLITRDIDLLKELAEMRLCKAMITINTLDEKLRRTMEPRTASAKKRLKMIEQLSNAGVPMGVMIAPIIPGLNDHEIPAIMEAAANAGARKAGYIKLRLNGRVKNIFESWVHVHFPDRAEKILRQVAHTHGGRVSDHRFGMRMRGEGNFAESINKLFKISHSKYFVEEEEIPYDTSLFRVPGRGTQLGLF